MSDLNHVALFASVVDAGSFSAAARQLRMPKATVSRGIAQLEADLGARLLNRTTRKLALTAQGRLFYDEAARGLAHLDAARERIAAVQSEPRGTLRVTAPVDFGSHHLMHWVAEFLDACPQVAIELRLTDALVDIVRERIDVALRTGVLASSSLIARKLAATRRVLVASPAFLRRHDAPRRIADLARLPCVVFGESLDDAVWRLSGPDGAHEIKVGGRISADGAYAAMQAVLAGLGLGLLPLALVAEELRAGRLVHLLPAYAVEGGLYAVYPSNRHISTALRAFLDFAARKAEGLPG
jgi:DNA-binding transcriptional LysR family regulator